MASVIQVYNADGSAQSVSLNSQVRADEVVNAIARRRGTPLEKVGFFSLCRAIIWREAEMSGAAGSVVGKVKSRVELKRLAPDERPLSERSKCEAMVENATGKSREMGSGNKVVVVAAAIAFAFLDSEGEIVFRERADEIVLGASKKTVEGNRSPTAAMSRSPIAREKSEEERASRDWGASQASCSGWERKLRTEFLPINTLGRGEKSGFLFQRSAANPREWQRRWCVLRRDEIIHCLSNLDGGDAHYVRLTHNHVRAIAPKDLGGLKHCFEIDTTHEVLQFRAKTEDEAKAWIDAIQRNMNLASENEKLHLAERMIEDGQRSMCNRDEAIIETALGSLSGLLSTHAGADRLYRFAKRSSLGSVGERNGEMVAFYLDLERAKVSFSSIPQDSGDSASAAIINGSVSPFSSQGSSGSLSQRASLKYFKSGTSVASSSGSSAGISTLRGSAAMLSRKEWMIQICERFTTLFEPLGSSTLDDEVFKVADGEEGDKTKVESVLKAAETLRKELQDESLKSIPRKPCLIVIDEASQLVLKRLQQELYAQFLHDEEYERIISTIPSRIRSR